MSGPLVRLTIADAVATVVLNRPEKRNALSRLLLAELQQTLDDLWQERRVRTVVLSGAGSAFSSGVDLSEMLSTSQALDANGRWGKDAEQFQRLIETMLRYPKPLVAAVNGPCVAGGATLMLACDVVVAGDTATFALPETQRGVVAGLATALLSFRIGAGLASYVLLSGQTLDANEAYRRGLFHEVVPLSELSGHVHTLAMQMAQQAPTAVLMTKRLLNETVGEQIFTWLSAASAASATSRTTEAATEGLKAFFEKRDPQWP
jgi:enoyl-CoA hydratase/carnithine racemase